MKIFLIIFIRWLEIQKSEARFGFKQSIDKFEYFYFVFSILSHYCSSYPYLVKTKFKGSTFFGVSMVTRTLPCFTNLYDLFYKKKTKVVPSNLFDILTYEGLAHWICGDGTFVRGGGMRLQTQSFTVQECVFIINVLIIKFNLKCSLHVQRNQPIIYISAKSMRELYPFISPYIVPSMRYKFTQF
jgi:hypothetical protein